MVNVVDTWQITLIIKMEQEDEFEEDISSVNYLNKMCRLHA